MSHTKCPKVTMRKQKNVNKTTRGIEYDNLSLLLLLRIQKMPDMMSKKYKKIFPEAYLLMSFVCLK